MKKTLRLAKIAFGSFPKLSLLGFISIVFSVALSLPMPLLTIYFIDKVLPARNVNLLNLVGIGLLGFLVLEISSSFFSNYLNTLLSERIMMRCGVNSFSNFLSSYYTSFISKPSGYWANRIQNEPQSIAQAFRSFIDILTQGLTFLVGGFLIFYFSPKLGFLVLLILPFYVLSLIFLSPRIKKQSLRLKEQRAKLGGFIEENLSGFEIIKSLTAENFKKKELETTWTKSIAESVKFVLIGGVANLLATGIASFAPIGVLWYGGYLVMIGNLTLGELIGINRFLSYIFKPIASFMNINVRIQDALVALERMDEIANLPKEKVGGIDYKIKSAAKIKLEDVSFSYDSKAVLSQLNLEIQDGIVTAIVGESGCGKSTLLRLVVGLLKPAAGRILIDGIDVSTLNVSSLRQQVCLIPQNAFLFSGTLQYNINLGGNGKDIDQFLLDATGISKLTSADLGNESGSILSYDVGSRGLRLSGGERQRVALARALIRDPAVLLMDEVTSEIDVETERGILDNIIRIRSEKTTVIVAHRISAIKNADEIVVLSGGKVVERGIHNELLEMNGLYRRLWAAQIGERALVDEVANS